MSWSTGNIIIGQENGTFVACAPKIWIEGQWKNLIPYVYNKTTKKWEKCFVPYHKSRLLDKDGNEIWDVTKQKLFVKDKTIQSQGGK